jgi:hypothetical protein
MYLYRPVGKMSRKGKREKVKENERDIGGAEEGQGVGPKRGTRLTEEGHGRGRRGAWDRQMQRL